MTQEKEKVSVEQLEEHIDKLTNAVVRGHLNCEIAKDKPELELEERQLRMLAGTWFAGHKLEGLEMYYMGRRIVSKESEE